MFGRLSSFEIEQLFVNPLLILGSLVTVAIIHHRYSKVGPFGILGGALIGSILGRFTGGSDEYYQGALIVGAFYSWLLATYFWMRRTG